MIVRLFFAILVSTSLWGQAQRVWFNSQDSAVYFLEPEHIIKKNLSGQAFDTLSLNPIPEQFPSYTPAWLNDQLHLASNFGGMLYRVSADTTERLDRSYAHHKQYRSAQFVKNDTLFRYGGYGFWRANNFFTYYDPTTKEWQYYQTRGYNLPPEASGGATQLIGDKFYMLGGLMVNPQTGLDTEINKELWVFDFPSRKWKNLGKAGFDPHGYVMAAKGDSLVLFDNSFSKNTSALLDFGSNQITFFQSNLLASTIEAKHNPFFVGDTLYYFKDDRLQQAIFQKELFRTPLKTERIYFDANTLFSYLSYLFLISVVVIVCVFLLISYRKRMAPTLVRGGIRCNGTFYALRPDEEAIVRLLYDQKKASNDSVLAQVANAQLSYSQNSKRKSDAIQAINKLFDQLAGKPLIVGRKAPQDKRQTMYYLTLNILQ